MNRWRGTFAHFPVVVLFGGATSIARYPASELLKSGWLQGESDLQNKIAAAEVRMGKARMV